MFQTVVEDVCKKERKGQRTRIIEREQRVRRACSGSTETGGGGGGWGRGRGSSQRSIISRGLLGYLPNKAADLSSKGRGGEKGASETERKEEAEDGER